MADRPEIRRLQDLAEKMAHLVAGWLAQYPLDVIYPIGGASRFHQFADVFRKTTGKRVIQATHPLLVTLPGIAMHSR
ncbi:hypothetical protein AB3X31_16385 [Raoultella terrigena]|uniref:hypothetical protein n=1 Tax=Raoultella terrigena TaxID=577 RepID=UPI00349FADA6